ncbi:ethanolamine ammonia-lyase subunit EutB, partial [Xanthomonas campestris]|uniref:ethanolamine ammonia-lyase subunit EutB n=1 Tax=Xanthomonas campestris TaxID=339 RepID=UPI001EE6E58F
MSGFAFSAGGERFRFADLKDLLAKATPARSGDQLAGLAAHSELQRVAAQMALAELPLRRSGNGRVNGHAPILHRA